MASVTSNSSCSRRHDAAEPANRNISHHSEAMSRCIARALETNWLRAVALPCVPEGGADGPDESWFTVGAGGGVGDGEGCGTGDGAGGASPRAEQPWPKKPARQPEKGEVNRSSLARREVIQEQQVSNDYIAHLHARASRPGVSSRTVLGAG